MTEGESHLSNDQKKRLLFGHFALAFWFFFGAFVDRLRVEGAGQSVETIWCAWTSGLSSAFQNGPRSGPAPSNFLTQNRKAGYVQI